MIVKHGKRILIWGKQYNFTSIFSLYENEIYINKKVFQTKNVGEQKSGHYENQDGR